ncbi:MAG TPA: hypothetical protein VFI25_19830 [Planctomycetota bacterium]|nr:hypothetical protein [Planctomycetota bacterium]
MTPRLLRARGSPAALALLALAPGCGTTWLADRARDFGQILDLDLSAGPGLRAYAGASHVAEVGWGSTSALHAGLRDGFAGSWREERSELGIGPLFLHEVDIREGSHGIVGHRTARFGEPGFDSHPFEWETTTDRRPLDLGLGAHLYFGASLELRLFELADFLAGLFGLDLAGDDVAGRTVEDLLPGLDSKDARVRRNADRALRILTGLPSSYRTYSDPSVLTAEQREAIAAWKARLDGRGTAPPPGEAAPRESRPASEGTPRG